MPDTKGLVEYVAHSLVENQEAVEVTEIRTRHGLVVRLHVAPDDMGRVIGKDGRIANAIRALARVNAQRGDRVSLDID
jgi:predicted RNA-binding protein YlqC (UPF0109 family)